MEVVHREQYLGLGYEKMNQCSNVNTVAFESSFVPSGSVEQYIALLAVGTMQGE